MSLDHDVLSSVMVSLLLELNDSNKLTTHVTRTQSTHVSYVSLVAKP